MISQKKLGDMHEYDLTENPPNEQNMDLWNNQIGRELAEEMKQKLGKDIHFVDAEWLNNLATDKILKKMNRGELITNPNDKRRYENMDFERLKESDRVYSMEELDEMDEDKKSKIWKNQVRHFREGNWGLPYENHLEEAAMKGDLIYVNGYVRSDGVEVKGYYRKRK